MPYKNDFGFNADDELCNPGWEDQPIELPLIVWTGKVLECANLKHELEDVRRMWADTNARLRVLENENAKLKGDLDAMLEAAGEVE